MPMPKTLRDRVGLLVRLTKRGEAEILAEAVDAGLAVLCREQISKAYLAGELDRAQAVAELGPEALADLEYARGAIHHDVAWGLKGA